MKKKRRGLKEEVEIKAVASYLQNTITVIYRKPFFLGHVLSTVTEVFHVIQN